MSERYWSLLESGYCPRCGGPLDRDDRTRCESCRKADAKYARDYYWEHAAEIADKIKHRRVRQVHFWDGTEDIRPDGSVRAGVCGKYVERGYDSPRTRRHSEITCLLCLKIAINRWIDSNPESSLNGSLDDFFDSEPAPVREAVLV